MEGPSLWLVGPRGFSMPQLIREDERCVQSCPQDTLKVPAGQNLGRIVWEAYLLQGAQQREHFPQGTPLTAVPSIGDASHRVPSTGDTSHSSA